MKQFYSYIRVSTAKQKEFGVSPEAQHDANEQCARMRGVSIVQWFEDVQTAAKTGRKEFTKMLKLLKQGKADGVIIHKIDRSMRNLEDWLDIGRLADAGIPVHFSHENLELNTRGGRLAADIQAVVAADFIRNLREETKKGFYGRLKQGIYPLQAPLGYLDCGKGKPKVPDPDRAAHVRQAFELYDTGLFGLIELADEIYRRGLRNRNGRKVTRNGLSTILNNPFFCGIIRLRKTGETFPGIHEPLIPVALFERVQDRLHGRTHRKVTRHDFVFRQLLTCGECGKRLRGELQKGHVYYRCHTRGCPTNCIREEVVDEAVRRELRHIVLSDEERTFLLERLADRRAGAAAKWEEEREVWRMRLGQIDAQLDRLIDAFLDGTLDKQLLDDRKAKLHFEQRELQEKLSLPVTEAQERLDRLREMVELANSAWLSYETPDRDRRRHLVKLMTSNRVVTCGNASVELLFPFAVLADRSQNTSCDLPRPQGRSGTELPEAAGSSQELALRHVVKEIDDWIKKNPEPIQGEGSPEY